MTKIHKGCICATALGEFYIEDDGEAIVCVRRASEQEILRDKETKNKKPCAGEACTHAQDACLCQGAAAELAEYMRGERRELSFNISFEGTPFERKVWQALLRIPYGKTRSYGEIACEIGSPRSARAVGGACHKNALLVAIPCHRVIGSNGALTGFGAGIDIKRALLALESENNL